MDKSNAPSPANISDDDIIDLTDIVEKGTIPNAAATEENLLEAQMSDLLGKPGAPSAIDSDDDFDLDALLNSSAIDLTADTILAGADSAKADSNGIQASMTPPAMPDEALNMPNMDEVDALLRDLVAPEQPASPVASLAPTPATISTDAGPEEVGMDDLDALLASLNPPVPATASAVAQAKQGAEEADIDDLDSLLDSIMSPDSPPAAAKAPPINPEILTEDLDDFDALLVRAKSDMLAAAGPVSAESKEETANVLNNLDDLDALLNAAEQTTHAEAAAGDSKAPVKEAGQSAELTGNSLDATLDAAEQNAVAHAPTRSKVLAEATEPMDKDLDLDELDALLHSAQQSLVARNIGSIKSGVAESHLAEAAEDPLSGLDDLLKARDDNEILANVQDEFPLEPDLGDPLLVGEPTPQIDEIGQAVLQSLSSMAADMAALQAQVEHKSSADGINVELVAEMQSKLEQIQSDLQDMAESHASGLAAAEARISALEAELTEQSDDGGHLAQLESRIAVLETQGEKAAAEVAARVIRQEIAALLAEMAQE